MILFSVTQSNWSWNNKVLYLTLISQKPQEKLEDDSEFDSLLGIDGAFDIGFFGRVRVVTGGQHHSLSPADCNLKPLNYSGVAD
jgi:hypothetical protein